MLPPRWVRRIVLAPLLIVVTVALVASVPAWGLVLLAVSPLVPGRWRPLRLAWIALVHLVLESALLVVMLGLWIASGFGWAIRRPWFERAHYRLVQFYLAVLFAEVQRVLHVRVVVEGPDPSSYAGRPLLVFSRHAGPGDSFLLVHALLSWYDREPRIVLKDTLQWDPAIDVVLNRLPNRFIGTARDRRRPDLARHVGELATGLDDNDAFVIFPEGGNFTELRRARAIERLRARGLVREAERAAQLRHVLAPRPGGVLAALAGARSGDPDPGPGAGLDAGLDADIVWVAHTGTDHMHSIADLWRELPMDQAILMRWWQVPGDEVPTGRDEQLAWLADWWERIDDWIGAHRQEPSPPLRRGE